MMKGFVHISTMYIYIAKRVLDCDNIKLRACTPTMYVNIFTFCKIAAVVHCGNFLLEH